MPVELTDFLDEFVEAIKADIERGREKHGDSWLDNPREGQEIRIRSLITAYFESNKQDGSPVRWESIAGYALIGWIRDNHPELF